jgi:hypothetical protein
MPQVAARETTTAVARRRLGAGRADGDDRDDRDDRDDIGFSLLFAMPTSEHIA